MGEQLPAQWFDGVNAAAQPCELGWQQGALLLITPDATVRRYAVAKVIWPERTRHGLRQLLLPDGGVVTLLDSAVWDAWAVDIGIAQPLAARWSLNWPGVGAALVALLALFFIAWRWGVPLVAEQSARWTPAPLEARLGRGVMRDFERRGWLRPSELAPELEPRITDAVAQMALRAYPEGTLPRYELHLRKAPAWMGPNAFALPGGDIIVTDALVKLLQGQSETVNPALLGVVAHELGHVREHHVLRLVFEAGAVSVLTGWWIGDYSTLLAGAPALVAQAGYSRDHERAADVEAVRIMRAARLDPAAMLAFFEALKKAVPERNGDGQDFLLASHPVDSERIRFFQAAAR